MKERASPMQRLEAAMDHFRRAIEVKQDDAGTYASVADAYSLRAEWKLRSGQSPASDVSDGLSAAARAISANRRPWDALAASGALHLVQAQIERGLAHRTGEVQLAQEELQKAVDKSRFLHPRYRELLAEARQLMDTVGQAAGKRPR
ncbi:MAG: hypothetical protein AB1714_14095 [Acidobacteriota bacterium]